MNFDLTEEQMMLKETASRFAQSEISPYAAEWDESAEFPMHVAKRMGELGMMGMNAPKEYGGSEMDTMSYVIMLEEIAAACASMAVTMSVHNSLYLGTLMRFGNEKQRKKYIPRWACGESIGAFALSEADAGSDAANQKSTAVKEGKFYRLNGAKNFTTSGSVADAMILFAVTNPSKGHKGISAFIVEKDFDGFGIGSLERKMGMRASPTAEIVLEDCMVPEENLLGEEGMGFKIAMSNLDSGRIGIATQALGIARAAFETAAGYANVRKAFKKPIGAFQGIQWKIADMAKNIDAARLLIYRAAYMRDKGVKYSRQAAMAKLFSSEMAVDVTRDAIQILGGYGYTKGHPVERNYRDAKITEIYEGTSEIQRIVIARDVLKEFAKPI